MMWAYSIVTIAIIIILSLFIWAFGIGSIFIGIMFTGAFYLAYLLEGFFPGSGVGFVFIVLLLGHAPIIWVACWLEEKLTGNTPKLLQ